MRWDKENVQTAKQMDLRTNKAVGRGSARLITFETKGAETLSVHKVVGSDRKKDVILRRGEAQDKES